MTDKRLNLIIKIASVFLAVSVIFCIFSVIYTAVSKKDAEKKRLENETRLAEMQLPTLSPDIEYTTGSDADKQGIIIPESDKNSSQSAVSGKLVVVLDAGHGKSSSAMSEEEKISEGYEYNSEKGSWGEWRHYKNGTFGVDCRGSGCTLNGSCWYPIGNGDRDTEPEINLNNALAAQKYLEAMGYEVRMTRTTNDQNPSMDKRVSYCFPNNDISETPDAAVYICIHSNAGGGRGTSYIALEDTYTQSFIPSDYKEKSNEMGDIINKRVAAESGLSENKPIGNEGYLVLFNKCPVPIAYLEIGFYDNGSDLAILNSSSDEIGKAIAEGVDEYIKTYY